MPRPGRRTRPARWAMLGLVASSIAATASRGVEPSPDEILRGKGLTRTGSVYTLGMEDDLRARVAELRKLYDGLGREKDRLAEKLKPLNGWQLQYRELLSKQQAMETEWQAIFHQAEPRPGPPPVPPPPPGGPPPPGFFPPPPGDMTKGGPPGGEFHRPLHPGEMRRLYGSLQAKRVALEAMIVRGQIAATDLDARLEMKLREVERRRAEALKLDEEMRARYASLAIESDVKRTLAAVNEAGNVMISPGPREDYAKRLQAMAVDLGKVKALVPAARSHLELKGMSRLTGLAGAADAILRELGIARGRLQAAEHNAESRKKMLAEQIGRAQSLAAQFDRATDTAHRRKLGPLLDEAKARTEKLRADQVQAEKTTRDALEHVADARDEYLRIVAALREAVDRAASRAEDLDEGPKARREMLTPPPGEKGPRMPTTQQVAGRLDEFERLIRTEGVSADVDKAILWVDAKLNGKPTTTMIVDFDAEDIRLPARVAAEVGVRVAEGDPEIEVTMVGGRTIRSRRARLATVQVGPVTASDVECLVLPEDYGEAPSLLGRSFLRRFATRFDPETGALVLTQVSAKPIGRAAKASTTKAAPPP